MNLSNILTAKRLESYRISIESSKLETHVNKMSVAIYTDDGKNCISQFWCSEEDVLPELESRGFIDIE